MASASSWADPASFMNAPDPTLTSSTRADVPSAIFFDMIELAMRGIDSDGARDVAERVELAIGRRQAGPGRADHGPDARSWATISAGVRWARQPGMVSILSSVPPVWPSPLPESWGTAAPQAATSGHRGRRPLSPDPAGRVLVDRGLRRRRTGRGARPLSIIVVVQVSSSRWSKPRNTMAIKQRCSLLLGDLTRGVERRGTSGSPRPSAPAPSRLARMTCAASIRRRRHPSVDGSWLASKAPGQHVPHRLRRAVAVDEAVRPAVLPQELAAPPARHDGLAVAGTVTTATRRPPPPSCSADTSPHSAHSASPKEAFSTLQPVMIRPSSTRRRGPDVEARVRARRRASAAATRGGAQHVPVDHAMLALAPWLAFGGGRAQALGGEGQHDECHQVRRDEDEPVVDLRRCSR